MKAMSGISPQVAGGVLVTGSVLSAATFILWGASIGHAMQAVEMSALAVVPAALGMAIYRSGLRKA